MPTRTILALSLALLAPALSSAASLLVTPDAQFQGGFGLRVTPGSACGAALIVDFPNGSEPGPTITGNHEACARLTAGDIEAVGTTEFDAGDEVLLRDGFAAGGDFTAAIGDGTDSPLAYVVSNCIAGPCSVTSYKAQFYLDIESLTLAGADRVEHFNGYSADLVVQFKVILKWNSGLGEMRLFLEAYEGGVLIGSTEQGVGTDDEALLSTGFNKIELDWGAGAAGHLRVEVNDLPFTGLNGLVNPTAAVGIVRWGVVGGSLAGVAGHLDLDEFASWN